MNSEPLVSVLMTSYNRERYIAEAIESVLGSSYTNFELIIVDDCSVDNTVSIAQKYELLDCRVKVYVNGKNLKQFANRNKAARYAKGNLLKYFDSDDVMYPDCLEVMVDGFRKYNDAGFVSQTNNSSVNEKQKSYKYSSGESYINHFFWGNTLLYSGPSACMFRKEAFLEFGGFDESIGILADTLLMFKIAAKYPVVGVRNDLFHWRIHDQQVTIGQSDWFEMIKQRFEINLIVLNSNDFPLPQKVQKIISRNVKSVLIRSMLVQLIKERNFREFQMLINICNLKPMDFISAFSKIKRINK